MSPKEVTLVYLISAIWRTLLVHGVCDLYSEVIENKAPKCDDSTERDICYQIDV